MGWFTRLSLPLMALALSVYGVVRLREDGGAGDGFLTAGAGLVCVGAFLVLEVQARSKDDRDKKE